MDEWIKQFAALFSQPSIDGTQILQFQSLKIKNLPGKLYKYRPVSNYSLDNLKMNTVWLNSANEYNDPYDSAVTLQSERISKIFTKKKFRDILAYGEIEKHFTKAELDAAEKTDDPFMVKTIL
ncbi:MAG: hypothetical protein ACYDFU_08570 [Nitrospirota bacterium]